MSFIFSSFPALLGCSVCWGADGVGLDGANAGVLFMLVVLMGVLGSFLSFIFYLARRSRKIALEDEAASDY